MAQSKNSDEVCQQIFDKGRRIEQEFAEYFTGPLLLPHLVTHGGIAVAHVLKMSRTMSMRKTHSIGHTDHIG